MFMSIEIKDKPGTPPAPAIVPPAVVPKDDLELVQIVKDSIVSLGWQLPKENCDSLASLKQLHVFAKANPKPKVEPKKEDTPPPLPPAMDKDIKKDSKDPKALYKLTVDSLIGPNKTLQTYTEADDKKLQLHMDALAADLYHFSPDPAFVIEGSGDENFTSTPPKPDKSAKWYATKEAKKAKNKEANA